MVREGRTTREDVTAVLPTRRFPDGRHMAEVHLADPVGNRAARRWPIVIDNTRPDARVRIRPVPKLVLRPWAPEGARRLRRVVVHTSAYDRLSTGLRLRVTVLRNGKRVEDIERPIRSGRTSAVLTAPLKRGPHRIAVRVTDQAGNVRTVIQSVMVRT